MLRGVLDLLDYPEDDQITYNQVVSNAEVLIILKRYFLLELSENKIIKTLKILQISNLGMFLFFLIILMVIKFSKIFL